MANNNKESKETKSVAGPKKASEGAKSPSIDFKVVQYPFTEEGRVKAIQEIEKLGLTLVYAHESKSDAGESVWEACGKNMNAAVRPGLSFVD